MAGPPVPGINPWHWTIVPESWPGGLNIHSDMWNNDSVYDRILVDSIVDPDPPEALGVNPDISPSETKELVIGSFSKDAIFYAYDRSDGTFLYARPTAYQNILNSYDGTTGAYTTNPDAIMIADESRQTTICRENRQIPQGAYSPLTNAYYVPAFNGWGSVIRVRSLDPTLETGDNTSTLSSQPRSSLAPGSTRSHRCGNRQNALAPGP